MRKTIVMMASVTSLALVGCASTSGGGGDDGPSGLFGLASSYDSRLEGLTQSAMSADTDEALLANAESMAALAAEASGKADTAAATDDADARLVWLSIAANAYDQAALLTPAGVDVVKTYRSEVLGTTTSLDELCGENTTDDRLGYRCATGTMFRVLNGSETELANFEDATTQGDLEAAKTSADGYGAAVKQDWPTYQNTVAAFPLGDQDLTPIAPRQIANACGFNTAANSGEPTWLNDVRTKAQAGDPKAALARNAYYSAAAEVAAQLAVEPEGSACSGDGERSSACEGQLERGLTLFCNAQSAG